MISRLMLNLRDPSLSSMSGRLSGNTVTSGNGIFSTYLSQSAPGGLGAQDQAVAEAGVAAL